MMFSQASSSTVRLSVVYLGSERQAQITPAVNDTSRASGNRSFAQNWRVTSRELARPSRELARPSGELARASRESALFG